MVLLIKVSLFKKHVCTNNFEILQVGGPDLFVTFTGNNKWEEIAINLVPPEMDWQSNPLTVCEVFYKKQQELIEDVVNQELFGPVIGYVYSIEFQKRGMPHMHLLVIMKVKIA